MELCSTIIRIDFFCRNNFIISVQFILSETIEQKEYFYTLLDKIKVD